MYLLFLVLILTYFANYKRGLWVISSLKSDGPKKMNNTSVLVLG